VEEKAVKPGSPQMGKPAYLAPESARHRFPNMTSHHEERTQV